MAPGSMSATFTPNGPNSIRIASFKDASAALEAETAPKKGTVVWALEAPTLTIRP